MTIKQLEAKIKELEKEIDELKQRQPMVINLPPCPSVHYPPPHIIPMPYPLNPPWIVTCQNT